MYEEVHASGTRGDEMVYRFFTATEQAQLGSLGIAERPDAFVRGWTRKQAYIKASGRNIFREFSKVSVSLLPGDNDPIRLEEGSAPADHWQMKVLDLEEHVSAALVGGASQSGLSTVAMLSGINQTAEVCRRVARLWTSVADRAHRARYLCVNLTKSIYALEDPALGCFFMHVRLH